MKVIFLDIDGVLNTAHSMKKREVFIEMGDHVVGFNQFDEICVENFNKLIEATGAKIVISSTWREGCVRNGTFHLLVEHLKKQGVKGEVIGHTPVTWKGVRNREIDMWLEENKESSGVEKYVIIDDDLGFFDCVPNNFVHIYPGGWVKGIQEEHVSEAIKILT